MFRWSFSLMVLLGVWLASICFPCTVAQYRTAWHSRKLMMESPLEVATVPTGWIPPDRISESQERTRTKHQNQKVGKQFKFKARKPPSPSDKLKPPMEGRSTGRQGRRPPQWIDLTPEGRGRSWKIQGRSCSPFIEITQKIEKGEHESAIGQYETAPGCRAVMTGVDFIQYAHKTLKKKETICDFLKRMLSTRPDKRKDIEAMHRELQRLIKLNNATNCVIKF